MFIPETPPDPTLSTPDQADPSAVPTRSGRLLGLVRRLAEQGRALIERMKQRPEPAAMLPLPFRFGTFDPSLIIARITRAVHIAMAFEARLLRSATRLDNPPARPASRAQPASHAQPAPADQPRMRRTRAGRLDRNVPTGPDTIPSAQEIAARMRNRSIGDVIADIVIDLGLMASHALWDDVRRAVIVNGGNFSRLTRDMVRRVRETILLLQAARSEPRQPASPNGSSCDSSGDPPITASPAIAGTGPP